MVTADYVGEVARFEKLYPFVFEFERNFDIPAHTDWIRKNWRFSMWYSAIYVAVIFGGKYYMRNRPRFELRPYLVLWSFCLAVFSIMGTARLMPEFLDSLFVRGFQHSTCSNTYITHHPTAFWAYFFAVSKIYEFGDTVFIVLRKQKLIFLHWYHHITVLMFCWYSYTDLIGSARWFMGINFFVHSLMYSYYTLKALRIWVPKFASMFITLIQLVQMGVGLGVNIYTYKLVQSGVKCNQTFDNFVISLVMYTSYFALFVNFFYTSYMLPKPVLKDQKERNGTVMNGHAKQH